MQVKLSKMEEARSAVNAIMVSVLPVKLSYSLSKTMKKLDSQMRGMDKFRDDLFSKYGVPDDKGMVKIPDEKRAEFAKEYTDYLTQEVDIDIWEIPLSQLIEGGVKLSTAQVISLDGFIVDDLKEEMFDE